MPSLIRSLVLNLLFLTALTYGTCHADQYLFLVGVKDYSQNGELTDLTFPEEDVHTLAELFSKAGVPESNMVLMTQRMAANKARFTPRSDLIRKELDLILNLLRPEDSIIVGFSGHGLQFKGDDNNYFCPIDAKPDTDLKDTLVSLTEVYRKLENCKANTKLLLVDACRNDPLSSTAKAPRRIPIEPVFSRPAPVFDGGTVAIFSCSASEQSFEHRDLNSGLFFYFINRALEGEADTDHDNIVDLGELENFAIKNVQKWAQAMLGKSQTPESRGTKRGAIELVHLKSKVVPKIPPEPKAKEILKLVGRFDQGKRSFPATIDLTIDGEEVTGMAHGEGGLSFEILGNLQGTKLTATTYRGNSEWSSWDCDLDVTKGTLTGNFIPAKRPDSLPESGSMNFRIAANNNALLKQPPQPKAKEILRLVGRFDQGKRTFPANVDLTVDGQEVTGTAHLDGGVSFEILGNLQGTKLTATTYRGNSEWSSWDCDLDVTKGTLTGTFVPAKRPGALPDSGSMNFRKAIQR